MGQHAKQNELWAEPVNLVRRIPEDHPLRKLQQVLRLEFVREAVVGFYGRNGNVSVDPVIIMKMMLLLFWDNVASERELMRIIPMRIDYLWFLGYSLEDAVPNHSVLSKARQRWGQEVFEQLFAQTVQQCLEAGLIDGEKLHVDSSLVRADASLNSVVRITVAKLEQGAEEQKENKGGDGGSGGGTNGKFQSSTDPEATLMRHTTGKALPSYKNHRALDDRAGVITVTQTTTGIVDDGTQLPAVVAAHEEAIGERLRAVIADSKYGIAANFLMLAERGIRSHMADLRGKQHNHRLKEIYPTERFVYDKASDTFRCPAGRKLRRHHFHHQRGYYEYRTAAGVCARCRLAHLCTRSKTGRTLNRYPKQELLDRARRQSRGPSARRDRKRRQWMQERNFGEAATEHGFKRARWRGLAKQTIQDQIIAALQNLKILIRNLGEKVFSLLLRHLRHLAALHSDFLPLPRFTGAVICYPHLTV
jgi:transposase